MWLDESLNSFFRRLCFTPDGSLLIVPSKSFLYLCAYTYCLIICDDNGSQVEGQKLEKRVRIPRTSLLGTTSQSKCILSQIVNTHIHNNYNNITATTHSHPSFFRPVLQLPGPEKPTVCVRCCPVLFELLPQTNGAVPLTKLVHTLHLTVYYLLIYILLYSLPYRMVFAVAGLDSVLLYDTQHTVPFAFVSNIHYAGITDMTWQV